MSFVPETQVQTAREAVCPTNGKMGKRVDTLIIKAMLNLPLDVLRNVEYQFCVDPRCPTVYYSVDGLQVFAESHMRERVYQKHPDDADVLVCYCFQHAIKEIQADGKSVYAKIDRGVRDGHCACDIRNPQGNCCLGNVNKLIRQSSFET